MHTQTQAHALDLADFISNSPSSYHGAAEVARRLDSAGFKRETEDARWNASAGGHYIVRSGAVVAWKVPKRANARLGFAIVGSHTDSPGFKVKPDPNSCHHGFAQVNVETYGGLIFNSWLNRDLGVAGRIVGLDGSEHLVRTGPIMVIPQLAPHLDRNANKELVLDPQKHLHPVWNIGEANFLDAVCRASELGSDEVAGMDLFAYDTQAPQIMENGFFAAGRQDNLVSVHASVQAFIESQSNQIAILAAFDHEEVGSATTTGASGPLLQTVVHRTALALGANEDEYFQMLARSTMVSADAGHSINPNYASYHDPDGAPILGSGPMIKVNANQRYATDSRGQALWLRAAVSAGMPVQEFVSNNAVSCGSTIGPLSATRLGIETVDVGIPLLSMHSVRELSSIEDSWALAQTLKGYWSIA